MNTIRVWAPLAKHVELVHADERLAMSADPHGWWSVDAPALAPGDLYAFSLDGGPARPDPRSNDQPRGVHGPSRLIDHSAYPWKRPDFCARPLSSAVIYELHVGTFTPKGTLDAAIERLDHLRNLGVTHVELMPLNAFDGERGWGYDGVCWFAPHRAYTGTDGPDAVKRYVDACHERGLAALLDVVYNHLGPSGSYLAEFGPYFSDAYSTPWGPAINLDGSGSDEVRRFICDNALMWLRDYRFDGLRIDAVHAFFDRSAVHILEQLATEVDHLEAQTGRPLALIAESDLNDPRVITPREAGGYGVDAQWSDDFHHALHALLTGETTGYYADFGTMDDLGKALQCAFVYDGRFAPSRGRRHGRPPVGLNGHRFLGYAQTHDQVGNRARGERLASLISEESLRTAAAIVMLAPFIPMLFQGEEWGARSPFQYFTDHTDPTLADAVRQGRRSEFAAFGWNPDDVPDPQDPDTFERSRLDWSDLADEQHAAMLDWYRTLIQLRRSRPELTDGRLDAVQIAMSETAKWIVMRRGRIVLACNLGPTTQRLDFASIRTANVDPTCLQPIAASSPACRCAEGVIALAPGGSLIGEMTTPRTS